MKSKYVVTTFFLIISLYLNAQTLKQAKKALKKVESLSDLEDLKKKYPEWNISIDKTLKSDSSKFPEILSAKKGDIVTKQYRTSAPTFVLKILDKEDLKLSKVKYIYIKGSEYSKSEIDSIRLVIIERYENGEDFTSLVKEYTMDGNPTGDLGWFHKGMMVEEFEKAVEEHSKDDIFTVDVVEKNWFYVVLKNHEDKDEMALTAISIQYSN